MALRADERRDKLRKATGSTRCRHEPSGLQIAAAKEELDKVLCDKLGCTEAYRGVSKVKES